MCSLLGCQKCVLEKTNKGILKIAKISEQKEQNDSE